MADDLEEEPEEYGYEEAPCAIDEVESNLTCEEECANGEVERFTGERGNVLDLSIE